MFRCIWDFCFCGWLGSGSLFSSGAPELASTLFRIAVSAPDLFSKPKFQDRPSQGHLSAFIHINSNGSITVLSSRERDLPENKSELTKGRTVSLSISKEQSRRTVMEKCPSSCSPVHELPEKLATHSPAMELHSALCCPCAEMTLT